MGLVSVQIIPEVKWVDHVDNTRCGGMMKGACGQSFGGGTGLGGYSSQRLGNANEIQRDMARAITINLRLICMHDDPEPLRDVRSNPVPERLI
jgi:hypothetical protein